MKENSNIVLVGFMGTGKTAVGKTLAQKLNMTFVDMDELIEERTKKSIPNIFAEDGEKHFRFLEREVAIELSQRDGLVIGAGGGIVLNSENISDFSKSGLVVCLKAEPDTILNRLQNDSHRPLLEDGDKMEKIKSILASRKELYEAISHGIDTTDMTLEQVAETITSIYTHSENGE